MASKLKQAVETEFTKLGMANDVEVLWWNLREQAGRPGGSCLLYLDFGSDFRETEFLSESSNTPLGGPPGDLPSKPRVVARLPRLQEIHENPLAKREAWKQIQLAISDSAGSTLV